MNQQKIILNLMIPDDNQITEFDALDSSDEESIS